MKNNLATTSLAIEASCVLTLQLKSNGYGADTIQSFEALFEDFCKIFAAFPGVDVIDAIRYWENNQNDAGEVVIDTWAFA
jgi:hypothetical protein